MKQKKVNPSRPVRRPVRQDDFIPRSRPCTASLPARPAVSFMGKLTLFGLYEESLLEIQNTRQWSDKRCKLYDRVMCQHLGPLFAERPLEDLSLDDYVRLWDQLLLKNLSERPRSVRRTRWSAFLRRWRCAGGSHSSTSGATSTSF